MSIDIGQILTKLGVSEISVITESYYIVYHVSGTSKFDMVYVVSINID